jgi:anti-sigma-K factor RskA
MNEPSPVLSVVETTALIALIDLRLGRLEDNIIGRLDSNAAGATERWAKHDADLAENTKRVVARFLLIEKVLDEHIVIANAHFDREHDAVVTSAARQRPVRLTLAWLAANWKDLVILAVGALVLLGILGVEWRALG